MKKFHSALIVLIIVFLMGCNLPQENPTQSSSGAETQAALTVNAELTLIASQATSTPVAPPSTPTPIPTNTYQLTSTNTPPPCNKAMFVTDVTIPDNTVETAGTTFTKTWRLQNIGSCTWNSTYQLVFISGDQLGVPTGYAQPLTTGYVSPGQNVDVSAPTLTAPMTAGTFTGRWGFREPGGTIFSAFIVVIQVPAAVTHNLTVNSVASEGGFVQSDGYVNPYMNVGDSATNLGFEAFVSFDISGIPTNATITQVQMDLTGYDTLGSPFTHLGCLKGYQQNYVIPLAAGAFVAFPAPTGEDHDWCSRADLNSTQADNDFKTELQAKLGASNRIQYRLQFSIATNSDGIADAVRFSGPKLIVTYTTP